MISKLTTDHYSSYRMPERTTPIVIASVLVGLLNVAAIFLGGILFLPPLYEYFLFMTIVQAARPYRVHHTALIRYLVGSMVALSLIRYIYDSLQSIISPNAQPEQVINWPEQLLWTSIASIAALLTIRLTLGWRLGMRVAISYVLHLLPTIFLFVLTLVFDQSWHHFRMYMLSFTIGVFQAYLLITWWYRFFDQKFERR